jgi:hypothetical protein
MRYPLGAASSPIVTLQRDDHQPAMAGKRANCGGLVISLDLIVQCGFNSTIRSKIAKSLFDLWGAHYVRDC